jgi:hypothetical protein
MLPEQFEAMTRRWRLFAAWEASRLRERPQDFEQARAWFAEAWDAASRSDPEWQSRDRAEQHWVELARQRRGLMAISPR